jgi:hypothetical protein
VRIADSVGDFVQACEGALGEPAEPRRSKADAFLRTTSWDQTWRKTALLLNAVFDRAAEPALVRVPAPATSASLGA